MKAVYSDRTVYTPFPDYEATNTDADATIEETRITYRLAGQIVALRVITTTDNDLYYPLTDRLGNVMALSDVDGALVPGSAARYDPFGAFTTTPTTNPSITNQGFTGHRHNNTGSPDLGLIYMNARYYLPEIGRFISPDSLVPDPSNPQSYNRYGYVRNNPINLTDPTGHKECGIVCENDVVNQQELKFGAAYGGEWDADQQAENAATAETVIQGGVEFVVGFLWEPADWGFALSDGFQWYDMIGMLPIIPATVGRYSDEAVENLVYRALKEQDRREIAKGIFGRSWPVPEGKVTPIQHVAGARHSPWISTGTKLEKIRQNFDSGNGIAVIDLAKVKSPIVDLSNGIPGYEGTQLSNWAKSVGEILIRDFVPPEAIIEILD